MKKDVEDVYEDETEFKAVKWKAQYKPLVHTKQKKLKNAFSVLKVQKSLSEEEIDKKHTSDKSKENLSGSEEHKQEEE